MKRGFLYLPLIFFIFLFGLDKIFTLEYFRKKFVQSGNVVYYRHREQLFDRFQKTLPKEKRKVILAMGDSRAYALSGLALSPERKKEYVIYNFSAAQAVVAYSLQWMERIVQLEKKPGAVFLVLSPEGFDDKKKLMHKPFMRLGAEQEFIDKYWEQIPEDDKKEYNLDQWVALRGIELDFKLLLDRWKSNRMREYDPMFHPDLLILNLYNGEQLAYTAVVNDEKRLQKDSERMANIYLNNFEVHSTQFYFLEQFVSIAKQNGVEVFLIAPRVYIEYRKHWEKLGLKEVWWKKVVEIGNKYSAHSYDLGEVSDCDIYYDASHQSTMCYDKQVNFLVDEWERVTKMK
jgi:hypothetical protein